MKAVSSKFKKTTTKKQPPHYIVCICKDIVLYLQTVFSHIDALTGSGFYYFCYHSYSI